MNAKSPTTSEEHKRVFSFETTYQVPIPVDIKRAPRANQLPFSKWFTDEEEAAREGKQPHLFVPKAYWVDERGAEADKAHSTYQKGKLRDQFNKWVKASPKEGGRDDLALVTVTRTGQEGMAGIEEEGTSIWLVKKD